MISRWWVLAILALCVVAAPQAGTTCQQDSITAARSFQMNMCDGWRAYRVGTSLYVLCPGGRLPDNVRAVELREYYTLPRGGGH